LGRAAMTDTTPTWWELLDLDWAVELLILDGDL